MVLLAFVSLAALQCVQDLFVAPPQTTYAFSLSPDSAVVNVGDTVAPFHGQLTADDREVGFILGLTVVEGAGVVRVDSLGRLIVLGRGVARIRVQPLSLALPVDTIADTVTVWAVVPHIGLSTARTEDTVTSLRDTFALQATPQTRSGVTIPSAPIAWRQVSGAGVVTLLDSATGRVRAEANGSAEFEATVDTAHARRTVRVVQRPTTLINTADTVRLRAIGQAWALGAALRDARANTVANLTAAWQSKNTGIATVTGGQIRAVGEGTTQVIASYSGSGVSLADTTTVIVQQARLALLSGNTQSGTVGAALGAPLVVQLVDGAGAAIRDSGVTVIFGVTSGGGHFGTVTDTLRTADTVRTDLQGQARTTPRLGRLVGANAVSASGQGLAGTAVAFAATGTSAPARTIVADSGQAQSDTVAKRLGQPFVVVVRDTFGNAVSGVRVWFVVTAGGGKFGGWDSLGTFTDAQGRARTQWDGLGPEITTLTLGTVAGAHVAEARAVVPVGAPVTFTATAVPGRARRLDFTVEPTSVEAGRSITPALQVAVRDTFGNLIPAGTQQVSLGILTASGTAGAHLRGTAAVAAVAGVAVFPADVTVDSVGTGYRLVATSGALQPDTSAAFDVTPGALDNVAFLIPPTIGVAGRSFDPPLQVALRDANGNRVTTARLDVQLDVYTVGVGGSGSLFGTATATAVNGVATFDDVGLGSAGTRYRLRARVLPALQPTVISGYFDVRGAPASLQLVSGNNQNGAAGAALAESLVVRVLDASGKGIPRDTVVFDVTAGGGRIGGATTLHVPTDTAGRAAARLTLGSGDGANAVTARSVSVAGQTVTFAATGVSGALHLDFIVQPATLSTGETFSPALQVQVHNAADQPVTTATPHITLAITSGTGRAGAALTGTVEADAVSGVATFPGIGVSRSGTAFTITASAGGSFVVATSVAFDIRQFPASVSHASADRQNGLVGATLAEDFVVRVNDAASDAIAGESVVFKIASGSGSLAGGGSAPDSVVVLTDAQGLARVRLTLPSTAGEVSVVAWAVRNALGAGRPTFFASATAAGRELEFVTQPSAVAAGNAISPAVQVRVRDASGVTDATATTNILLAITSGSGNNPSAVLQGRTAVSAVSGVATFDSLVVSAIGTGFTLTASATGLVPDTSTAFAATSGGAAGLEIPATPGPAMAGAPFAATVRVVDGGGNLVTTSTAAITVAIASGHGPTGAHLTGTLTVNAVNGIAPFTTLVIDSAATTYALTFTASGLAAATTSEFAVTPGVSARLAFEAPPSQATAGAPIAPAIRVWVLDALGNRVTTATTAVALAFGSNPTGATLEGTTSAATVNGVATFADLRIRRAGPYTLVASASGLTGATSATIDVIYAPANRLAFTVQPSSAVPGVALSPAVRVVVQDSLGNQVTAATTAITLAITSGTGTVGAVLAGTVTANAAGGVATFSDLGVATQGTNYTLTASASGLAATVSIPFSILATTAERLVFVVQPPSALAGAGFGTTVQVAVRDGLGNTITTVSPAIQLAVTANTGTAGAALLGTTTQIAANGVASFPGVLMEIAGTGYTLTATASGLASGTSASFTVLPAAPARLEFQTQPGSRTAGNVFTPPVQVALRDGFNNLATTTTVNLTVELTSATAGGAALAGTRTVASANGVATFADLSIAKAGTGYTLTASASGMPSIASGTFSITVGTVATVTVSPTGASISGVGTTQAFTATAKDSLQNVVGGAVFTWTSLNLNVATVSASTGVATAVASGQGTISATTGGVTGYALLTVSIPVTVPVNLWAPMSSGTTQNLNGVWGSSGSNVYAVGAGGAILRYDGTSWTTAWSVPGVELRGVWGTGPADVFVVGDGGTILHYNGSAWSAMTPPGSSTLWGVWGSSSTDVYAVGTFNAVYHFDGSQWSDITATTAGPPTCGGGCGLISVWGTSRRDVYIGGAGGQVRHYDGNAWAALSVGSTDVWYTSIVGAFPAHVYLGIGGLWAASSGELYFTGTSQPLHFDGSTWSTTSGFVQAPPVYALWGTSPGDVFGIGYNGAIVRGLRGAAVTVTPATPTLTALGATLPLVAQARESGGAAVGGVRFTWASATPGVATVDTNGVVTAVANGTAQITATAPGGASGSTTVTVSQVATAILMTDGLAINGPVALSVDPRDAGGNAVNPAPATYSSLNSDVATVDATGHVTPVTAGQTTISVTMPGGATAYTLITVAAALTTPVNLWTPMAPPSQNNFRGVWGLSAGWVYAVGAAPDAASGQILRLFPEGWTNVWTGQALNGIWGASWMNIFAVGPNGFILHFDGSSWSAMISGTTETLNAVWGASPRDVWAVGANGTILHYDGTGWSAQASGVTRSLRSIWGASRSRVWAVGDGGTILQFDGTSWTGNDGGQLYDLLSVWGTGPTFVETVGSLGRTFRFDGSSWAQTGFGSAVYSSTHGTSPGERWIVGSDGTMYYWSPGGASVRNGTSRFLRAVFATTQDVFVVGDSATILRGLRGATVAVSPAAPALTALGATLQLTAAAKDASNNVVAGVTFTWSSNYDWIATVDSTGKVTAVANGTTAITATAPGGASASVTVTVGQVAKTVAVSSGGASLSGVGSTTTLSAVPRDSLGRAVVPGTVTWTSLNLAVATVDPASGVVTAVSAGQAVLAATAGTAIGHATVTVSVPGATPVNLWVPMATGTEQSLSGLWASSATDVFAVGGGGTILHFNGSSWSRMSSATGMDLYGIWGSSGSNVYAGGRDFTLQRYDGGSWASVPTPSATEPFFGIWGFAPDSLILPSVCWIRRLNGAELVSEVSKVCAQDAWGTSRSDIFVVGRGSADWPAIDHYNGTTWSPMTPGGGNELYGVWGLSSSRVYAVGVATIQRFDGATWTELLSSGPRLNDVWGSSASDIYVVGEGGTVLRSPDGTSWNPSLTGTSATLRAVWGTAQGDVFVAGDAGTVLRGLRGATVIVTPENPTLTVFGATPPFTATARDAATAVVSGVRYTWTTSNPPVATVDTNGVVTAVANGTATITATAPGGAAGLTLVTVVGPVPPVSPTGLGQFRVDGTTAIAVGGQALETRVVISGSATDVNAGAAIRLQVEVRPLATPFSNSATDSSASFGTGQTGTVSAGGLAAGASYHWQVRACDETARCSAWVAYGGNVEADADLVVSATPSDATAPVVTGVTLDRVAVDARAGADSVVYTLTVTDDLSGVSWVVLALQSPLGQTSRNCWGSQQSGTPLSGTYRCVLRWPQYSESGVWQITSIRANDVLNNERAYNAAEIAAAGWPTAIRSNAYTPELSAGSLAQFRSDETTAIGVGAATTERAVVIKGGGTDADAGDHVRLDVEVRTVGTAFSGTPTHTAGPFASGGTAAINVGSLSDSVSYHWQARVCDEAGACSAWTSFGGNAESAADFKVAVPIATVAVTPAGTTVSPGSAQPFTVEARDAGGTLLTNRGVTWTSLNPNVATVSASTGVVTAVGAGQATIQATVDGVVAYGLATVVTPGIAEVNLWMPMTSGTPNTLHGVWGMSASNVFAVGGAGTVLHFDGSNWSSMSSGTANALHDVWGSAANDVFAVGASGTILRFNGANWSAAASGVTTMLTGVWGSGPNDVFAVGPEGAARHFDGSNWSGVALPAWVYHDVWGTSARSVYLVTDDAGLLWNLGSGWDWTNWGGPVQHRGLWGTASLDVYIVGSGGAIRRYPSGAMTSGTADSLHSVWGTSSSDIYAVGDRGTIRRYNGTDWSASPSGTASPLRGVWGSSAGDVYAVGDAGTILRGVRGASVTVTPAMPTITALGATQQMVATARDAVNNPIAGVTGWTWVSNNTAVATVNASTGVVTAVANGTATINATAPGGVNASTTVTVNATGGITRLAAGASTTCSLTADGTAYCWGYNSSGQLGDGTTTSPRTAPTAVVGGLQFQSLGIGPTAQSACGVMADGTAYCWGMNSSGQLGNGSTAASSTPSAVAGGLRFRSISTANVNACGVTTDDTGHCWGDNANGQLGNGTTAPSTSPTPVSGGLTFASISTGYSYSCGLTTAGAAFCWGNNPYGQLGNGTTSGSPTTSPVAVLGSHVFQTLTVGRYHACGLESGGAAWCWGYGAYGNLGNGGTSNSSTPVSVSGGPFTVLYAGWGVTCGIESGGTAYCWGYDGEGQVGDGTAGTNRLVPTAVAGGHTFASITGGVSHTCARRTDGALYCWGANFMGDLGTGRIDFVATPTSVTGGQTYQAITDGGYYHQCGLTTGGTAYCWGTNQNYQLGDGTQVGHASPAPVGGGLTFARISTGGGGNQQHTCGLTADGTAYCWGWNNIFQLGDSTSTSRGAPVAVKTVARFQQIVTGQSFSCGLASDSTAYCWGSNGQGQLGDNTTTSRRSVTPVVGGLKFVTLSAGYDHACGVTSGGAAYCWGSNSSGQLGDGTTTMSKVPVVVTGGQSFQSITAGWTYTCGLTTAGAAYCWGWNVSGNLGDGTTTNRTTPAAVAGGLTFQALRATGSGACGVTSGGVGYCWGSNLYGDVGDGTTTDRYTPTPVAGGTWLALAPGRHTTCGLDSSGAEYCWGDNIYGQVGNGSFGYYPSPQAVIGGITFLTPRIAGAPSSSQPPAGLPLR